MASHTDKKCGICNDEYDQVERCPRVLACSHTLCTLCIENLIRRNTKCCPFCRTDFTARTARDVVINRSLLDALDLLKEIEQKAPPIHRNSVLTSSKRVNNLKKYTENISNVILTSCQETEGKVNRLLESNSKLRNSFLQVNEKIKSEILAQANEMLTNNVKRIKYLNKQDERLERQKREIVDKQRKIKEAKNKLAASKNFRETGTITDDIEEIKAEVEYLKEQLVDDEAMSCKLTKVAEVTNERAKIHMEAVKREDKEDLLRFVPGEWTMNIEALKHKSPSILRLIRSGKVFAIKEFGGQRRSAKLTLIEDNKIHLHCLRLQTLPSDAYFLKHDDVMNLIQPSSRRTFLEFAAGQNTLGTVYIRVSPDTKRGQNFALLCTGERGYSYLHTTIIRVANLGKAGEFVEFGDYERNDGSGGKTLVPGAGKEELGSLWREWFEGLVATYPQGDEQASLFYIITKNAPGGFASRAFGNVESGLNILANAIKNYPSTRKVKINDSGLVLPL